MAAALAGPVVLFALGCGGANKDLRVTDDPAAVGEAAATDRAGQGVYAALALGSFPAPSSQAKRSGAADRMRAVEELRRPLPVFEPLEPLDDDVSKLLGRAAEALARNDLEAAEVAASDATEIAPERPEPVEVQFLVALGTGRPSEVRKAVMRLAEIDPRNSIPIAFAGLEGVQDGDDEAALACLAWFVGRDALPRRGVAVPLPTAAAELEEQCALSALRLGHPMAAMAALDAAAASVPASRAVESRLALLRADALRASGDTEAALELLRRVVASPAETSPETAERGSASVTRALATLATLRIDAVLCASGLADDALSDAVRSLEQDLDDSVALLRIERLAPLADRRTRDGIARRLGASPIFHDGSALRLAAVRILLADDGEVDSLSRAAVADSRDRAAMRLAMRLLARRGVERAAAAAIEAAAAQPNELDAIARALLGCGADVESILGALRDARHGASSDALRSRIYGQYGFPEEAFAIADAARARDRASAVALAACAFAAAELEDPTLLAEIDDDALASGDCIARTLAACALRLGDADRAVDRARRATSFDPADRRAHLLSIVSALRGRGGGAQELEQLRTLASGRESVSGDAFALLVEIERGGVSGTFTRVEAGRPTGVARDVAEPDRSDATTDDATTGSSLGAAVEPGESAQVLVDAARQLSGIRHPLAIECLALAEEVDPALESGRKLALQATRPNAPTGLADWAERVVEQAPALPSRRRIVASLREPRSEARIPEAPLDARFDALELASEAVRARDLAERASRRPRTPAALAAKAEALDRAGEVDAVVRTMEELSASTSGPLPALAARRLLAVASGTASRNSEHAEAMQRAAMQIVARLATVGPEEIAAAMRLAIAARVGSDDLEQIAAALASSCRTDIPQPRARFSGVFETLLRADDDPYPVARLADALAREQRLDRELRGFFCNAAVALQAAAGGPASQSEGLIRLLVDQGVRPFARSEESQTTLSDSLLRAASAYSLVGDAKGSEDLLRSAIAADPNRAVALNNLAFSLIESGRVNAAVVSLAERAAQLAPDDPAVLDTLGVLRYHQGRLRDDAAGPGAITLFRQALRVDPDDPSLATLDHLGDALWRDGDQAGAVRCWQQVAQVAKLRYPPEALARGLMEFQRREFGVELVAPAEFVQKEYGRIVDRAEQKLQEVARGFPPSVAECRFAP